MITTRFRQSFPRAAWACSLLVTVAHFAAPNGWAQEPVDFNRDVRPILNRACVGCHGGVKQAGGVSFIYREQSVDAGVITPGDPDGSELLRRVISTDPDERMPPVDKHPEPLPADEIDTLRRWIAEGAAWGNHWSHERLSDPPEPQRPADAALAEEMGTWPRQPLDRYVLHRLQAEGLAPSAEAAPAEWLRRVHFDLVGLPPSADDVQRLADACAANPEQRDRLYAAEVDRLLDSAHFGERWAAMWLDLARYADSMGFEKDPHREMWPYRDWLIRAFNADLPFDLFTQRQLAGDLLPDPTADDLVATAFHRNTQCNTEGGTDDEEFRTAAVIDRVNTTWTVWQATTFGCVQCHSHPYEPFRHEEYYRFLDFFNSTEDCDLDDDYPTIQLPSSAEAQARAVLLDEQIRALRAQENQLGRELALAHSTWTTAVPVAYSTSHGTLTADDSGVVRAGVGTYPPGTVYTVEYPSSSFTAMRLWILPEQDDPKTWPETGSVVSHLQLAWKLPDGELRPLTISDAFADHLSGPYDVLQSLEPGAPGFGGYPKLFEPRWAVFTVAPAESEVPADARLVVTLHQDAQTTGARPVHLRRFRVELGNSPDWQSRDSSPERVGLREQLRALREERRSLDGIRVPVMRQRAAEAQRPTRVFTRGNWLARGEQVAAGVPAVLPPLTTESPTRLELAQWLTAADNPLTARVWVNRIWAELWGLGIVETLEDFGSTGTPPADPQLLDHLAWRMQHHHQWHLKPFLRELVLSATYRQSHHVSAEARERDPRNRLFARGPRTRLSAEMVRDQALAVSGLFAARIGGPSVMPPQPDGIWRTVYNANQWVTATGEDRYRRAIYTYWRRTSPYPSFMTFDAPSRESCSARRVSTNTPLQALVTLNDPVYLECAAGLGQQAEQAFPAAAPDQIAWLYQRTTQQPISATARDRLLALYHAAIAEYQADPAGKESLGATPAAYALTVIANTVLNLDGALTK